MNCPTCGQHVPQWRVSAFWMNDNHTFVRLNGTPDEMIEQAKRACLEYGGGGMLGPPRWVDDETKQERPMKGVPYVHDKHGYLNDAELRAWAKAVDAALAGTREGK